MIVEPTYEARITEGTRQAMAQGADVLQIYWLHADKREHCAALLWYLDPPLHAVVADMGSGIGAVASLLTELRQDLTFLLVNNNRFQLDQSPVGLPVYADFHETGLQRESVDAVMFNYSLGYADLGWAFIEAARITKPGGRLLIWDLTGPDLLQELGYRVHGDLDIVKEGCRAGWRPEHARFPEKIMAMPFADILGDDLTLFQERTEALSPVLRSFTK